MTTQNDAANQLTKFLTESTGYRGSNSPLQEVVNSAITQLMADIAHQIIKENQPELREVIRSKVLTAIEATLRNESWVNHTITSAVAKALVSNALDGD